jgi:nucleotide-binding universal stress UspA family protein
MSVDRSNVVIVGIDGSAPSVAAARWAADEADRRKAELHLLHAYSTPSAALPGMAGMGPEVRSTVRAHGGEILDRARVAALAAHPGLAVTTTLTHGLPVEILQRESEHCLALVLGTAGRHEFTEALLGSVSGRLAGHASCPVVVVRAGVPDPDAGPAAPGPVVVGLDGTESCERAMAFAFESASLRATELIAVHSWDDTVLDGFLRIYPLLADPAEIDEDERRILAEQLSGWAEQYPDVPVRSVVLRGRPEADLISSAASGSQPPALIVVGTRGGGRFTSLVVGSTSHALLADAPCPVAVVRGKYTRSTGARRGGFRAINV